MSDDALTPGGNTLTDWAYAAIVEPQGLAAYGITHDGYTFAERVALIRSYADLANDQGSTFVPFELGSDGMTVGDPPRLSNTSRRSPDYYYQMSHAATAPFRIRDLAGSGQRLRGRQYFGFTETSDTPRHETAQVAAAGRFYPTLDFSVNGVDDPADEAVERLRFDFWIQPDVGPGGRRKEASLMPGALTLGATWEAWFGEDLAKKVPQQAGLFRDRDHSLAHRALFAGWRPGEQVFSSAEKPLLWEVAADGILEGGKTGWDNVHIWGVHPDGLVSTPGMPFGMHLHWRWAAALTNRWSMVLGDFTPDFARAPELAGRDAAGDMVPGGPLIDPRNPVTDLRVAVVTKDTADTYAGMTAAGHDDFLGMFQAISPRPKAIDQGAEIVLIVSIVVHRERRDARWDGTVFPHGVFFPHAYDVGYLAENALTQAGAYEPQYLDRKPFSRRWFRPPN
jgi:hypothetical protein